jgi:hypothetical protein
VSWPASSVALDAGVDSALEQIPQEAGVGQVLAAGAHSLTIGRPANLRKWFAAQLGRAVVKKGQRPPTDLTAVARELRFTAATSSFQQRLAFERLMARYVAPSARRDLKAPAWLHVDPRERFPRVSARTGGAGRPDLFGPFRDRRAADRARDGLHKLLPLRPCDYTFEPAPDLALGVGCLYAQVRSCAAPCLRRIDEEGYRGLAGQAAAMLASPAARAADPPSWLPAFVSAASTRAVIAEAGSGGFELYPVVAGVVDEASAVVGDDLPAALARLQWRTPETPGGDEAWLMSWLYEKKRRGVYVVVEGSPADERVLAQIQPAPR